MLENGIGSLTQSLWSTLFGSDKVHTAKAAVNFSGPMDEVLSILSRNVHRLAVIDPSTPNKLLGLITQLDVR
jgi:CBS domain-containing protein